MQLTAAHFFAGGVNGAGIACDREGIDTIYNCEINRFCIDLLRQNWPKAKIESDVKKANPPWANIFTITSECQDISIANNKAAGVFGGRSVLIFSGLEVVRRARPDFVCIENSASLTQRGLEYVLCRLAEIGYNAEWQALSLRTFGVQQNRARIYILAYSNEIFGERASQKPILSKPHLQEQFARISLGWRERRDIPSPRTIGNHDGIANWVDRVEAIGNMAHPRPFQWMLKCIKDVYGV